MRAIFESNDVIKLVGIGSIYLNKFVERKLYGIAPSARVGEGRGSRRWFNREDVFGIALVWWLFEAGLRSEVIKRVLRDISKTQKANANIAAIDLRKRKAQFLVIIRTPRLSAGKQPKWTPQSVNMLDQLQLSAWVSESSIDVVDIIPVGKLFSNLEGRISTFE